MWVSVFRSHSISAKSFFFFFKSEYFDWTYHILENLQYDSIKQVWLIKLPCFTPEITMQARLSTTYLKWTLHTNISFNSELLHHFLTFKKDKKFNYYNSRRILLLITFLNIVFNVWLKNICLGFRHLLVEIDILNWNKIIVSHIMCICTASQGEWQARHWHTTSSWPSVGVHILMLPWLPFADCLTPAHSCPYCWQCQGMQRRWHRGRC